ncbi:unnamed protein product [Didymodactylos carnosus]|uniref:Uncharacterized protein n=1 Tax=Didymodactylos carnosus TaxID=1234261 RepID=A0A8S2U0J4_9BILA|nr:unnamed protein product [Didymodactylos carnosus]CAF4317279.1 unnamed protein product [Didymodactylos carnosus]
MHKCPNREELKIEQQQQLSITEIFCGVLIDEYYLRSIEKSINKYNSMNCFLFGSDNRQLIIDFIETSLLFRNFQIIQKIDIHIDNLSYIKPLAYINGERCSSLSNDYVTKLVNQHEKLILFKQFQLNNKNEENVTSIYETIGLFLEGKKNNYNALKYYDLSMKSKENYMVTRLNDTDL